MIYTRGGVKTIMNLKKMTACAVTVVALATASVVPALAGTFANFALVSGSPFSYINTGATSKFTLISTSVPVTFNYFGNNGYNGNTNVINATMTFTALVDNGAAGKVVKTVIPFFGTLDTEGFKSVTISFKANTAVGGKTNLLTLLPSSTGFGSGKEGGQDFALSGDTNGTTPSVVNYSSDFLDFTNVTDTSYNLSFTSVAPLLKDRTSNGTGSTAAQKKDYFQNFKTAGNGSFSSTPYPFGTPEPAPVAGFVIGGLGLAGLALRGRKAARLTA